MARRSPRWRKPPPKVLSTPESKYVELCYALEGKGYAHMPRYGQAVELLLIDQDRNVRWVSSPVKSSLLYAVDEECIDCLVLGWRRVDGLQCHGDYDVVDPELADFASLSQPNRVTSFGSWAPALLPRQDSARIDG